MGRDPQVAHAGIGGQHEGDRRRLPTGAAALLEDVGDRGGADGAAADRLRQGRIEGAGADLVEQVQQARRLAGERLAAAGEGVEEGVGVGAGVPEAVAAPEVVGPALLGDEGRQVGLVLDALAAIVAAGMAGDLGGAVQEAHRMLGGDQRERLADQGVGDRVVVPVEADVRGLAGADGAQEVAGKRMLGKRQEPGLLLGEGIDDPLLAPVGDRADMGDLGDPAGQLGC